VREYRAGRVWLCVLTHLRQGVFHGGGLQCICWLGHLHAVDDAFSLPLTAGRPGELPCITCTCTATRYITVPPPPPQG
jgi:hypothetical protein